MIKTKQTAEFTQHYEQVQNHFNTVKCFWTLYQSLVSTRFLEITFKYNNNTEHI